MNPARALLFVVSLAVGGVLWYVLLSGGRSENMLIFLLSCAVLGGVFNYIDRRLRK